MKEVMTHVRIMTSPLHLSKHSESTFVEQIKVEQR